METIILLGCTRHNAFKDSKIKERLKNKSYDTKIKEIKKELRLNEKRNQFVN